MLWMSSTPFQPSNATAVLPGLESTTRGAEQQIPWCPVLLDHSLIKSVFICDVNNVIFSHDAHFSPVDLTIFHILHKWIFGILKIQFRFSFYSSIILGYVCVHLHIDARGWMSSH